MNNKKDIFKDSRVSSQVNELISDKIFFIKNESENVESHNKTYEAITFFQNEVSCHNKNSQTTKKYATKIKSGNFELELDKYFIQRTINAKIHPIVENFLKLNQEAIINRYSSCNPKVNKDILRQLVEYQPKYFKWGGCI